MFLQKYFVSSSNISIKFIVFKLIHKTHFSKIWEKAFSVSFISLKSGEDIELHIPYIGNIAAEENRLLNILEVEVEVAPKNILTLPLYKTILFISNLPDF